MAARTTPAASGKLFSAAGTIVALGIMVAGCQARSAALAYEYEVHVQQVAAWCYNYLGVTTASQQGQDCIRRAWAGVPSRNCFNDYTCAFKTDRHRASYHARLGRIEK